MDNSSTFWSEFATVETHQWVQAIEQSLKGKPYTSLGWKLDESLTVEPFYRHAEQVGIPTTRRSNEWQLVERVDVGTDLESARLVALQGLEGGASAIAWQLQQPMQTEAALQALCQGIHLSMIELHWEGQTADLAFLKALQQYAGQVAGSVEGTVPQTESELQVYRELLETQPRLALWTVRADRSLPVSQQLAQLLQQTERLLFELAQTGLPLAQAAAHIRIVWTLSDAYLLEIAQLRAFRRLWATLLSAYGLDTTIAPHLYAQTIRSQADPYSNMIAATAQAMAAVIGHADSLLVLPCTDEAAQQPFAHRIARNIQHLLAMESHLHRLIDPASGSYYFETLTDELAQSAWKQFQAQAG